MDPIQNQAIDMPAGGGTEAVPIAKLIINALTFGGVKLEEQERRQPIVDTLEGLAVDDPIDLCAEDWVKVWDCFKEVPWTMSKGIQGLGKTLRTIAKGDKAKD